LGLPLAFYIQKVIESKRNKICFMDITSETNAFEATESANSSKLVSTRKGSKRRNTYRYHTIST
jgi:hypothetical protein